MKKLWKSGLLSLLAIGLLVSTAGAAGLVRSGLDIEQRANGFFFQARTNRPERKGLLLECRLSWLPEDFEEQKIQSYEYSRSVSYADREGKRTIQFEQLSESSSILVQSQKGDKLERVTVKGKPGGLIHLAESREDLNLIWYDAEAESYFSMLTHGLAEEELFQAAQSVDVRNKFEVDEIPGFGFHDCPCGGTFWQFRRPLLQKTIDKNSPDRQGVAWIYCFQYICDGCNWHIDIFRPAVPVD